MWSAKSFRDEHSYNISIIFISWWFKFSITELFVSIITVHICYTKSQQITEFKYKIWSSKRYIFLYSHCTFFKMYKRYVLSLLLFQLYIHFGIKIRMAKHLSRFLLTLYLSWHIYGIRSMCFMQNLLLYNMANFFFVRKTSLFLYSKFIYSIFRLYLLKYLIMYTHLDQKSNPSCKI